MSFRFLRLAVVSLAGLWMSTSTTTASDIFVSPNGDDNAVGTTESPVASIGKAKFLASKFAGKEAVTVHFADGTYYVPETMVIAPSDSGTTEHPVIYKAVNEGKAILSGGTKLELNWQPYRDGIYQAKTQSGLVIDQLFVNGRNQRMARYPNYDATKKTEAYQGFAADAFDKTRAAKWTNPEGGYIHAMHRSRWGGYHYRITGKDANGEVTYEGGWQNNRKMGMHDKFRMVENIFEELDAPGEWFHDAGKQTLYFMPPKELDLAAATVEVVRLRHVIEFQGTKSMPVKHIRLQGFVIRHAARTFMDTKESMLRSDWAIYRGGSIFLTGTEDVQILDTRFDQVGGNAVFASNYNRRVLVKGCHIHDAGASGVCFVGDPNAVRDPLFEYGQKNDLSTIDRTPGPKSNNYPADSIVEDCLIHGIGRVERQPAGVQIEMAQHITVRDCSVYDCARAGINIGDGAWGGHLIERCDVFDTVQETHDHGSFNSWGRDRYWRSDQPVTQAAVDKEPNLPFLDAMATTTIRDSRFRCDHGWDIDLDDGSSNYDIYNNLLLSGGLKLREGFRRRAWNNITVNNGLHPHVWYNESGDEVHGNIFMASPRGARMPSHTAKGKRVDGNFYYSLEPRIKEQFLQFGWDVHSVVADPQFLDPAKGDFRVADGSPALKIGFKNFPMDRFGVKKTTLKAVAATPVIPELQVPKEVTKPRPDSPKPPAEKVALWKGARLQSLKGEEFSAFGVSKEDGGVALSQVGASSDAAKAGLREGDLIQGVNGTKVKSVDDFLEACSGLGASAYTLKLVRNQATIELKVRNEESKPSESTTKPEKKYVYSESVPEPTLKNVRYGGHSRNILDFWKAPSDKPTPVVISIHGGGWNGGDKTQLESFVDASKLLKAGISVVAINYRLIKHSKDLDPYVCGPMSDAARSVQFVRSMAGEWNIDKSRIAATGGSAGACTSLWLAYHDDLADPTSPDPVARESTRLKCVAVSRVQTTLDPKQMREWIPNGTYGGHAFGKEGIDQFLADRDRLLPMINKYSPYALLTADDPTTYLYFPIVPAVGKVEKDPTHSAVYGVELQKRCKEFGVPCELVYPDAPEVKHPTATDFFIAMLLSKTVKQD